MVGFTICCRVEARGPHRFVVTAEALPFNVELRCAPEERSLVCASEERAREARPKLARALARDVLARGNRVVEPCCDAAQDLPRKATNGWRPDPRGAAIERRARESGGVR